MSNNKETGEQQKKDLEGKAGKEKKLPDNLPPIVRFLLEKKTAYIKERKRLKGKIVNIYRFKLNGNEVFISEADRFTGEEYRLYLYDKGREDCELYKGKL